MENFDDDVVSFHEAKAKAAACYYVAYTDTNVKDKSILSFPWLFTSQLLADYSVVSEDEAEINDFMDNTFNSDFNLYHYIKQQLPSLLNLLSNDNQFTSMELLETCFQNENNSLIMKSYLCLRQKKSMINFISHGWHDLCPYIILEYYNLDSLNNYLHSHKLSWSICYSFFASLLNAIDYLHYEDLLPNDYLTSNRIRKPIIIHRDIKSSNILIKSNPTLSLCLSDFGLAKILPPILTPNDFIQIGTYRYMAPELLELAITHTSDALCKVDMYAVGLVLWEIVTQCQDYSCKMNTI
ncbi:unnamed protein product [Rotaria sp. Silwood1]|nr:unnamed protein product [Rotaria sp. Silwood1]